MPIELIIRNNAYQDSMVLMQINHKVAAFPGVSKAAILMATEPNKRILENFGFVSKKIETAKPSDLIIGLEATGNKILQEALDMVDRLLTEKVQARSQGRRFGTQEVAIAANPDANLVLISTPGQFAAREARRALSNGKHVFIFSDNVSLSDELELKQIGREKGLLVMGPDCGTAIIDGVGIGFANRVTLGPVGIIGASGSGIQELSVLLYTMGVGVSHAIGIGSRDLSEKVKGSSCFTAMDLLSSDQATECLIVLSKPPSPKVAIDLVQRAGQVGKPVILCLLGQYFGNSTSEKIPANVYQVSNIEQAAIKAGNIMGVQASWRIEEPQNMLWRSAQAHREKLDRKQRYLRGLFSGGSLCYEAMVVIRERLSPLFSNIPIDGVSRLQNGLHSSHNTLFDLGEDEFTLGRVHPMIDPSLVVERIIAEASDPEVAIVLFDMILGSAAHEDPALLYGLAVEKARKQAESNGCHLIFISHVCGTDEDPQNAAEQIDRLQKAGVIVSASNRQASELACDILTGDRT